MASVFSKIKSRASRVINLILKELESLFKDKQALLIMFLLPILVIFAIGSTSSAIQGKSTVVIGIIDLDTSTGYPGQDLSLNFTRTLDNLVDDKGTDYVVIRNYTKAEIDTKVPWYELQAGKIDAYIEIPEGFETAITTISVVYMNITTDATNIAGQANALNAIIEAIAIFKVQHDFYADEILPSMDQLWFYNTNLFRTAGPVFAISIFGSTLMTASQSVVGDVPLKRMLLTPARKAEVILAKLLAYMIIGFFQILILIGLSTFVYQMPISGGIGGVLLLILLLLTLAFAGITLGLFISVVSTSRLQASQYFLLAFIMMFILTYFVSSDIFGAILPLPLASSGFNDIAYKYYVPGALDDIFRISMFGIVSLGLAFAVFYLKKSTI
ncbi:MAG: ABC transporter permease [Candidatus Lokiarchaeota archaeon]|nr:ABC transporter permease [Candidatus Lokiarchaeota archaeon]